MVRRTVHFTGETIGKFKTHFSCISENSERPMLEFSPGSDHGTRRVVGASTARCPTTCLVHFSSERDRHVRPGGWRPWEVGDARVGFPGNSGGLQDSGWLGDPKGETARNSGWWEGREVGK